MSIFEILLIMALMAVLLWFAMALGNTLIRAYLHGRRFKKKKKKYRIHNGLVKLGLNETAYIFAGHELVLNPTDLLWAYFVEC